VAAAAKQMADTYYEGRFAGGLIHNLSAFYEEACSGAQLNASTLPPQPAVVRSRGTCAAVLPWCGHVALALPMR